MSKFSLAKLKLLLILSPSKCGTWTVFIWLFFKCYMNTKWQKLKFFFPDITSATYFLLACWIGGRYTYASSCRILYISFLVLALTQILFKLILCLSIFGNLLIILADEPLFIYKSLNFYFFVRTDLKYQKFDRIINWSTLQKLINNFKNL